MQENKSSHYSLPDVSAQELSKSLLVRRTAAVSEAGLADPLTAYWEDPFSIPFVPIAIELIRKIDANPEIPALKHVIVDLSQASQVNEKHPEGEGAHPNGSNEARIIVLLLDRARDTLNTKLHPPVAGMTKVVLPPEIGVNRSLFRPGNVGKP